MRWFRQSSGDPLTVSMCGIKLGDRLLVVGSSDTGLVAALGSKAGLTGRACLVDESDERRQRAAQAVEQQGALIESFAAPWHALPFAAHAFDVVVLRNALGAIESARRPAAVREAHRVLRPGGRCIVIDDAARRGLSAMFGGGSKADSEYASAGGAPPLLTSAGFRGVRTLAEREGVRFVEGVKPA